MRDRRSNLRDESIPSFLYLLNEILRQEFKKGFDSLSDQEIKNFLIEKEIEIGGQEGLSVTTIKKMFKLLSFDTGYRPLIRNVTLVLNAIFGYDFDLKSFEDDYEEVIADFFNKLNYKTLTRNPKLGVQKNSNDEVVSLAGATLKIDLNEGCIQQLLNSIYPVLGSLIENEVKNEVSKSKPFRYSRINKRLEVKEERRQHNVESIVKKAISYAKTSERGRDMLNEDWIHDFFDLSQNCSTENLQHLWARLLVNQIDNETTLSRRVLHTVKILSQRDAMIFNFICNSLFLLDSKDDVDEIWAFMIEGDYYTRSYYSELCNITQKDLEIMADIGLVRFQYRDMEADKEDYFTFYGIEHAMTPYKTRYEFSFVELTYLGQELFQIAYTEPNMEFYKKAIEFLELKGLTVKRNPVDET